MPRKRKPSVEEQFFALPDQEEGVNSEDNGQQETKGPTTEDLLKQISALTERLDRTEKANLALMTQAPVYQPQTQQLEAPKVDMSNLPDPSLEPERYAAEVAKRTQEFIDARGKYNAEKNDPEVDNSQRAAALWNKFSTKYKKYAGDPSRVEFAAVQVANELRSQGVDLNRYMFGPGQETYLESVKDKYEEIFLPKPLDNDKDDDNDEDNSRSATVLGGIESAGRHSRARKEEDGGDMVKEIQEIQIKSGLY